MCYCCKFIKTGNTKLGNMYVFNKLSGNSEIGGCMGTCGNWCGGCWNTEHPELSACYNKKSYNQYGWENSTVCKSHIKNTEAMRNDTEQAFKDLQLQINRARKKPEIVRIHASGEIETLQEFASWVNMANNNPEIIFYIYSKNELVVDQYLTGITTAGDDLPHNFILLISVWHYYGISLFNKWKHLQNVRSMVYLDGKFDYSGLIKINAICPAYDENGKLNHNMPCSDCQLCINAKVIGSHDHS